MAKVWELYTEDGWFTGWCCSGATYYHAVLDSLMMFPYDNLEPVLRPD